MDNRICTYTLNDALFLYGYEKNLSGYFWCYPDDTESEIIVNPTKKFIKNMYKKGIFLGRFLKEDVRLNRLT